MENLFLMSSRSRGQGRRTGMAYSLAILVLMVIAFPVLVQPVHAREPAWNYSSDAVIRGIAISSKGDQIAAGAEKVLFFARNGTLLSKAPYGNIVLMTPDGTSTASAYFSTVYFFSGLQPVGAKAWEYEFPQEVRSLSMSSDGSTLVASTVGNNVFIFATKTGAVKSNNDEVDSVVTVSPDGKMIVGISSGALHVYNKNGVITRTSSLATTSAPHTMLLSSTGSFAVFNDGQTVRSVNTNNGKERWSREVAGFITSLSRTPTGSTVIAGTGSGTIAAINALGNSSWTYGTSTENRQASGITCTALSDNGAMTAAGTADGRVLFLNVKGELTDSYSGKEPIRHIDISADGSTVIASSDSTLIAFIPGASPGSRPVSSASSRSPTVLPSAAITGNTMYAPPQPTIQQDVTTGMEIPSTYSVIHTATQSPASPIIAVVSLILALLALVRKR